MRFVARYWMLDARYWILVARYQQLLSTYQRQVIGKPFKITAIFRDFFPTWLLFIPPHLSSAPTAVYPIQSALIIIFSASRFTFLAWHYKTTRMKKLLLVMILG